MTNERFFENLKIDLILFLVINNNSPFRSDGYYNKWLSIILN